MAQLTRDPLTGQYSFADPSTAVINQTTGQTANTMNVPKPVTSSTTNVPSVSIDSLNNPPTPFSVPEFTSTPVVDTSYLTRAFDLTQAEQAAQEDVDLSLQALRNLQDQSGQEEVRRGELEVAAGIPEQNKQLNEIFNQIRQNNAATFGFQQTQEDRLAPTFAISAAQAQAERQNSVRNFGLAAAAEALQGNITLAQDNIQRALDAEFKPLQAKIDFQKTLIEANYDKLDRATQRAADRRKALLDERSEFIRYAREDRNAALALIPDIAGSASNDVINSILNASSLEEAVRYAAPYLTTEETQIVKFDDGNTALINSKTGEIIKNYGGAKSPQFSGGGDGTSAPYGSVEYLSNLFSNSRGGDSLTGDQIKPLTKAVIVLSQVEELTGQITKTTTDPILGILRNNNPYDAKAREIRATLRATVPNLARGVYGEVGVLTDTDIENYIQTLPNITSPEEANKLVLAMTLNVISNSFGATLESYANGGRDVSGYVNQFNDLQSRISSLRNEIGVGGVEDFGAEFDELNKGSFGFSDALRFIFSPLGF